MDEHLKKRLLGASVLVALGVIFIPALLDNRGDDRLTVKMEIPEKPKIEIDKPLQDLQARKEAISKIDFPPPPEKKIAEVLEETDAQESNSLDYIDTQQNDTAHQKISVGEKVPITQAKDKPLADDGKVESNKKTPANRQWILQIGSFGQESNATSLVNKLRKENWKAFKEVLDGASGKVYRVRLGPIDERKQAEDYRRQLVDLGYKHTIIMSHP